MPTLTLDQDIQTTTVHELPDYLSYGPLANSDEMLLFKPDVNKTLKFTVQDLVDIVNGVGAGTFTPVINGDTYIYDVPESAAGSDTASIPELAGKNFKLRAPNGVIYKTSEYQILNGGGFKLLKTGEVLVEGTRYELMLYSLVGGAPVTSNDVKPLIIGSVSVSTNITYDVVNHVNKLLQLRGGSTQLTITLADVGDVPDNTIIVIEAMINNTVEHKIQTSTGQNIYMNNTSYGALYMRAGEVLWLYRSDDGYYVINQDFAKMYNELVAYPRASYKVGLNELNCNGQQIEKAKYRRALEVAQSLGASFIDKATYDSDPQKYKGCWVDVDSTYIQLPDLTNGFLRGIKTGDTGRPFNNPGGFQDESLNISSGVKGVKVTGTGTIASSVDSVNSTGQEFDLLHVFDISPKQGTETRPVNIGVYWTIKV
jgi:hypothetical protein